MKPINTFKEFLNEESLNEGHYKVREESGSTSMDGMNVGEGASKADVKVVGWFSNKYNPAFGWALGELDSADAKEFNPSGDTIFRSYTEKGTNIVKINAKTGKYAFIDNNAYENGVIKFERMTKYKELYIDHGKEKFFL